MKKVISLVSGLSDIKANFSVSFAHHWHIMGAHLKVKFHQVKRFSKKAKQKVLTEKLSPDLSPSSA